MFTTDYEVQLEEEVRGLTWLLSLLVKRLGNEVTVTPFELATVESDDTISIAQNVDKTWTIKREPGLDAEDPAPMEPRRHRFHPGYSGRVCDVMVMREGAGDSCGLPAEHTVHDPFVAPVSTDPYEGLSQRDALEIAGYEGDG